MASTCARYELPSGFTCRFPLLSQRALRATCEDLYSSHVRDSAVQNGSLIDHVRLSGRAYNTRGASGRCVFLIGYD